jgi:two-component system, OmpR family, sensor kinase
LTRFTADASHELRTPLTVIRTHAQLALTRPRSVEDYRQTIETCLQAAGRMTAIVEGLLTLARADAGKLGLRKETVSLSDLVTEGADLVRPLAEARGIGLQVDVTPVDISADREALTRIISNLLSNAVRYNRPGGAVCVHLGKEATAVVLSVRDTGVGIPEADQAHIFDRFFRVDRARARSSGGMGLGLAICRSLAEAHGGTIDCESRENEGSTFRLRLPVKEGCRNLHDGVP